jgi:hypothetical protein
MHATHDQFSRQMRCRLKTTAIGLGLVRLLEDAKRFDEARETLYLLEEGFQDAASEIQSGSAFSQPSDSNFATVVAAAKSNASAFGTSGSSA